MSATHTSSPGQGPRFECQVRTAFVPERSTTPEGPYAFSYTITIRNTGDAAGQLVARRWLISEAGRVVKEVRGLAVVGHQPLLQPGEHFEYTSWVQIDTPTGRMEGTFYCMSEDAYPFEVAVPAFDLIYPGLLH